MYIRGVSDARSDLGLRRSVETATRLHLAGYRKWIYGSACALTSICQLALRIPSRHDHFKKYPDGACAYWQCNRQGDREGEVYTSARAYIAARSTPRGT
ncbi:hypothetical protein EVAR_42500_1 [Eumeta japonica]|uniref:Uncharacterized protein n=1 Tax=Eumeta variegata TaxID=151549 RepID=A0A4C1XG72_EUMVA|nr:hypothetical protein EVAR_42500_1 [Eumeta japonica]